MPDEVHFCSNCGSSLSEPAQPCVACGAAQEPFASSPIGRCQVLHVSSLRDAARSARLDSAGARPKAAPVLPRSSKRSP